MTTSPALHPAAPVAGAPAAPSLDVYVAGLGHVGGALLGQIAGLPGRPVRVVGACTRRRSALDLDGLDGPAPALGDAAPDWPAVLDALAGHARRRPTALVDATGSP